MYTSNCFCFGHQLASDKKLNNLLQDWDVYFKININGRYWVVDFPYHGGQIDGDTYSCIFGTNITDDDDNPFYIDEVRNAKEEDYLTDYKIFLGKVVSGLEQDAKLQPEFKDVVDKLKKFLQTNKPKFYSVEISS